MDDVTIRSGAWGVGGNAGGSDLSMAVIRAKVSGGSRRRR